VGKHRVGQEYRLPVHKITLFGQTLTQTTPSHKSTVLQSQQPSGFPHIEDLIQNLRKLAFFEKKKKRKKMPVKQRKSNGNWV